MLWGNNLDTYLRIKVICIHINEYENEIPSLTADLKKFVDSKNYGKLKISK